MKGSWIVAGTILALVVLVGLIFWAENTQNPLWNSLRPIESVAESLRLWSTAIVFVLSGAMLVVASLAYQKNPSKRFLFLTMAFGIMFAKFGIKLIDFFYSPGIFFSHAGQNVFDLFVLASLFLAIVQKD